MIFSVHFFPVIEFGLALVSRKSQLVARLHYHHHRTAVVNGVLVSEAHVACTWLSASLQRLLPKSDAAGNRLQSFFGTPHRSLPFLDGHGFGFR